MKEWRLQRWNRNGTDSTEAERLAALMKPPAPNPEHLTRLVKIKRTGGGFLVNGKPVEPGQIVSVTYATAMDLVAIKKAELIENR